MNGILLLEAQSINNEKRKEVSSNKMSLPLLRKAVSSVLDIRIQITTADRKWLSFRTHILCTGTLWRG